MALLLTVSVLSYIIVGESVWTQTPTSR